METQVADGQDLTDPRALLGSTRWMRSLARSLVPDDAAADDVVQQACLALVRSPPLRSGAAVAWVRSVIRNLAYRRHREEARRRDRESRVARPEASHSPPSEALERAELQKTIVTEVLALDEPYRTTVVLRFFEELSAQEIARRQGVPEKTVRTRLARALERLRTRLDAGTPGGRSQWCILLLPWLGPAAIASMVASATSAAGASAPVSGASAATSVGVPLFTAGGVVVSKLTWVIVGGVTLALGVGVGRYTAHAPTVPGAEKVDESDFRAAVDEAVELKDRLAASAQDLRSAEVARDEALSRVQVLEAETAALKEQLRAATALEPTDAARLAKRLAVSFGEFAELDAFKNADWEDMAAAVEGLNALLLELFHREESGEPMPEGFAQQIQRENARLLAFAAAVISKIPTHSPINGEFTHPLATANLMASLLERADLPTSESQRLDIAQVGERYEREYARLQGEYGEDTLSMTKILDELELKRDSVEEMRSFLSVDQLDAITRPELHNRYQLDALSPFISALSLSRPAAVSSAEDAVAKVRAHVVGTLQLSEAQVAIAAQDFERWARDVAPILTPIPEAEVAYMHLNDATVAGRAYERLLHSLSRSLGLGADGLRRIRSEQGWIVPRLVQP